MKRFKSKFIIFTSISLLILLGAYSYSYFSIKKWNTKFYPNVSINNIDLSGKTKNDALNLLKNHTNFKNNNVLLIKSKNRNYTIKLKDINPKYNIEDTLNKAYSYGKNLSFINKLKILFNPSPKNFPLNFDYDKSSINNLISTISKDITSKPIDASISANSSGKISITADKKGNSLDTKKLLKNISTSIADSKNNSKNILEIEAPIILSDANIKKEDLLKINSPVSSFETSLGSSSNERITNISLATKKINGTLLMPGNTFSFYNKVGEVTKSKGFKEAPIIVNDKLQNGIGGGLCQVSSTLYNSIIRLNIPSLERTNHSLTLSYLKPGFDATVSGKEIDYKFKNTLNYPLYIQGYVKNRKIVFNIYSHSSLNKIKYDLKNEIYENLSPKTVYKYNSSIPSNTSKVYQKGIPGCKVKVYLIGYENNKQISKKLVSNDTYNARDEIIIKNAKNETVSINYI